MFGISIPLDALPTRARDTTLLPISFPLHLYTAGTVSSLKSLHDRIGQAGLLPPGICLYMYADSVVCIIDRVSN